MLEQYFSLPAVLKGHREGPLGPYLDSFVAKLAALGYPRQTIRLQCCGIRDLGLWLDGNGLAVTDLSAEVLGEYLDDRRARGRFIGGGGTIIGSFVDHLRDRGVVRAADHVSVDSPIEHLISRYTAHLEIERGLVRGTIETYIPFVRRFLTERFGERHLSLRELIASDVSGFVLRWAHSHSPGRAKLMVTALRSFLRFLFTRGEIETDLADCVPSVADWRLSTVPKHLSKEQVECVIATCDRKTSTGRRNYALLLLLARLGLRAGEVVALELGDIDWRAGEVWIRGKGSYHDRMPLPVDVGKALAVYLRRDRPTCSTRRVFVRVRAPHRGFRGSSAVDCIVSTALRKAGLNPPARGAHLLRHSLATEMLRSGASMTEIGQVLRHRNPNTTEIYAKVDMRRLRRLAQQWPVEDGR